MTEITLSYTQETHKMLHRFKSIIKTLFSYSSYGKTLELYITSRNPQNAADIEKYTMEFNRHLKLRGGALW